jgi:hypothetical protein
MATLKVTRWGGLKPIVPNLNLADHMLTVARDVDLSRGTLKPWRTAKSVSAQTGQSLWVEDCCIKTFADCNASVAYHRMGDGRVIATNAGQAYPVTGTLAEFCSGDVVRLGFPCDLSPPTVTADIPKAWERFDDRRQSRSYAYRLVNRYGELSQISQPSIPVDVDALANATVTLPTAFAGFNVVSIEVLRSEQSPDRSGTEQASNYFVVGEVPLGTAIFLDEGLTPLEMADDEEDYTPPPEDLRDVQYWGNDQFIGLSGNSIAISREGAYNSWPYENYRAVHDRPIALSACTSVCFVATDARPAVIQKDGNGMKIEEAEDTHPIVSKRSMVGYNNHALYASKDGIVMIAPSRQCKIITSHHYTRDQWQALLPDTMHAVVHDGHYFGFFENETIRFRIPDGVYEEQGDISLTTLSIRPTAAYRSLNDELYYADAQGVWQWNNGTDWQTFYVESAPLDMAGITEFAAFKLICTHARATIEHWVDQERIDLDLIDTPEPVWLPSYRNGISWSYTLASKGEVTEYSLSTSINDLAQK